MAELIGYERTKIASSLLDINASVEVYAPDCGLIMIDAGKGGAEYLYLKQYSAIQLIGKMEPGYFKLGIECTERNVITITCTGSKATPVFYKYINFA